MWKRKIFISPDNKCTKLKDSDDECYDDYMYPPLHLCHHSTADIVGKCKKQLNIYNQMIVEVKKDKKHANYGYIRYHYDKKKLKEKLIKAIYHELTKDDDTAECLLDVVKQLQLSGEKIKFSSLLVSTFAVLLL